MSGSKKKSSCTEYEAHYDPEMREILRARGMGDLYNEIELIRYMNLVTLKRMNAEGKKLSYRDHLATLRAVTLAAGEIAHLAGMQNKIFRPLVEMENKYKAGMEDTYARLTEMAEKLMGEEKVGQIQMDALMQVLRNDDKGR